MSVRQLKGDIWKVATYTSLGIVGLHACGLCTLNAIARYYAIFMYGGLCINSVFRRNNIISYRDYNHMWYDVI